MKKIIVLIASLFIVAVLVSSCGSHKGCDAYGKANQEKPSKEIQS